MHALVRHWEEASEAAGTIDNKLSYLRALCAWAGKRGMIKESRAYASDPKAFGRSRAALAGLPVSRRGAELWRELMTRAAGWRRVAQAGAAALVVEACAAWMEERAPDKRSAASIDCARTVFAGREGSLEERIGRFARLRREKPTGGAAVLCTMHAAKGLEWDFVWIAGTEETVAPDDQAPLEEERRLFYVAMTRARERLVISHTDRNPPSRFLYELEDR